MLGAFFLRLIFYGMIALAGIHGKEKLGGYLIDFIKYTAWPDGRYR